MRKLVFGLNRPDDTPFSEFRDYWLDEHAPLAAELPGLQRYTVSFPDDPDRSQYDGLAELWFEDRESLDAALDSDAGEAAAQDLATFAGEDMLQLVVEEHVVV
jgi:uncharacterized protein (TIGR02118 family)